MGRCIGEGLSWPTYIDWIMNNGLSADCGCDDSRCFSVLSTGTQGPVGHDAQGCLIPFNPDTCVADQQIKLASWLASYTETETGVGDAATGDDPNVYGPGTDGSGWYTRASLLWQPNYTAEMEVFMWTQVVRNGGTFALGDIRVMVDAVAAARVTQFYINNNAVSSDTHLSMHSFTLAAGAHNVQIQYRHIGDSFFLEGRAQAWRNVACPTV